MQIYTNSVGLVTPEQEIVFFGHCFSHFSEYVLEGVGEWLREKGASRESQTSAATAVYTPHWASCLLLLIFLSLTNTLKPPSTPSPDFSLSVSLLKKTVIIVQIIWHYLSETFSHIIFFPFNEIEWYWGNFTFSWCKRSQKMKENKCKRWHFYKLAFHSWHNEQFGHCWIAQSILFLWTNSIVRANTIHVLLKQKVIIIAISF